MRIGRMMFWGLIGLGLAEIGVFALFGQWFGALPTVLGVIATSLLGAVLLRRLGLTALRNLSAASGGPLPARQVADGMLVAIAAVLLIVPGYLSDLVGLLLLLPPVRAGLYALAARKVQKLTPRPAAPEGVISLDRDNWRER